MPGLQAGLPQVGSTAASANKYSWLFTGLSDGNGDDVDDENHGDDDNDVLQVWTPKKEIVPPSCIYDAINIKLDKPVIDQLNYFLTEVPQGLTVYSEDGEVEMTANPVSDCDDDFHGCLLNLKENENV